MRRCFTESRMRSPFAHQAERAAGGAVRRHMQHDGAEGRAAHARVGNAHHVLDAFGRELLRDRQIAGLRHRGGRMRAGILQHQNILRLDVELGIVDARGEIGERGKHHRPALELEQIGVGGRALEDRALRRQIAEQRDQPALRLQRLVALRDDAAVDPGAGIAPSRSPRVSPVTVMASRCSRSFNSRISAPMPPAAKKSSM